jgi:Pyruvate/2-oxoacid:ferredoxin oxidoreductase delta subunit
MVQVVHQENIDQLDKLPSQIMEELMESYSIPQSKQVSCIKASFRMNKVVQCSACVKFCLKKMIREYVGARSTPSRT